MAQASSPTVVMRIRTWSRRPKVRLVLKILGLAFVTIGAAWSVLTLDLSWRELSPGLLLLNVLLLTPLTLVLGAVAFQINALAIGCNIPSSRAISTIATANVAELLPLPGGAIVRGAALVDAGASVAHSTRIVVAASLLTLLLSLTASLAALSLLAAPVWAWAAALSALGLVGLLAVMARFITPAHLLAMIGVRTVILGLALVRIGVAFATLGAVITWIEAALYSIAPTLGTTVAIVPAGLGVNEAIAAGLAAMIASSSASAFLAMTLNRVLGLLVGAALVFVLPLFPGARQT